MSNCASMSAADDDRAFLPRESDEDDYRAAEDSSQCAAQATVYKRLNKKSERAARGKELAAQTGLIRDIFGNPFRPVAFSPSWRTDTAVALARQMYESRDFGAMPILADALQDAGCENTDILAHCRIPGLHVRGCWVLDAVLNKQ
ncbi:hypothetical protein [Frigoriglobus tundricola]|nr:hypothetical protein [Frigoriglobus tundricola]